ncbi:MAG: exo-alpha-sialidase [Clostridia bacterium]|nr:exo-alpha-sialidase [Clostridia bacterium]
MTDVNDTTAHVTEPAVTDPPVTDAPEAVYIHSFDELNTESATDSHGSVYRFSSLEMNFRQQRKLESSDTKVSNAMYPRVKQMNDGTYFVVYQQGKYGSTIYFATSKDLVHYSAPKAVLSMESIKNGTDKLKYMTADACIAKNGDIIIVSSYRAEKAYSKNLDEDGIVIIRSSDGGKTWSKPQNVYIGLNWEPNIICLPSGELQIFFTHSAPMIHYYGMFDDRRSNGAGLLRSTDDGKTWSPLVTGAPYEAQRAMQQYVGIYHGQKFMADQMPVACVLNNGTTAIACESYTKEKDYKISIGVSEDNFARDLAIDEEGPAKRANNMFEGAGPYLDQFESGETLLTYNTSNKFYARLGSCTAIGFGERMQAFEGESGYWGSCMVDGTHSAVLAFPTVNKDANDNLTSSLNVGRFFLNHDVSTTKTPITLDGNGKEWTCTDAHFVGSETQAQLSVRYAFDKGDLLILAERLDTFLTSGDCIGFILPSEGSSYFNIRLDLEGVNNVMHMENASRGKRIDAEDIEVAISVVGTVDDITDDDTGAVWEIRIPSKYFVIEDGYLSVIPMLLNKDTKNGKTITDMPDACDVTKRTTWLRVSAE